MGTLARAGLKSLHLHITIVVFHTEKLCDMYALFRKPALMPFLNQYIDPFRP